ncbi:MAG: hypothetical protein ACKV2O_12200 [Acidimicrobiales bacterium]
MTAPPLTSLRLVIDSGALRKLAEPSWAALALLRTFRTRGLWPAMVPTVVVTEALTGDGATDAAVEALLRCCDVREEVPLTLARRAAWLRAAVGRGSGTDALLVAMAEPGGAVLVTNRPTVEAMALFADGVFVERI